MRAWLLGILLALTLPLGYVAAQGVAASCYDEMVAEMSWDYGPHGIAVPPAGSQFDPALPASVAAPPAGSLLPGSPDSHPCDTKIQPGATMGFCTMNFIFRNPNTGDLYFGSAGHCLSVGQVVTIHNVGAAGVTVFSTRGAAPDFSLVRIYPSMYGKVDPTMCHWGGPKGVDAAPGAGETTQIYGWGLIYGQSSLTRPRAGAVLSVDSDEITYLGFAQPGDSGSPIITYDPVTGAAHAGGVHVRSSISFPNGYRVDPSPKYATRVDAGMAAASQALGVPLEVVDGLENFSLLGY